MRLRSKRDEFYAAMRSLSHAQRLCREDVGGEVLPWHILRDSVVIDVGGGDGQSAIDAARRNPHVRFVVQDVVDSRPKFLELVPEDLSERATF